MLENALDYEGLKYYDGKSKDYIDEKVSELQTQVNKKVDKVDGKGLSTNDYTTAEKTKLSGIATGAEVNQNAFSNVVVGSTTISADSKTDSLTLVAGSNVTITPDATNDKVTIAATDTVYTHPTSGATAGTYRSVTVNAQGHVTAGTNPTTTVAQGGTGVTTLASGQVLVGNGTSAVTTRAITNNTAVGDLGYTTNNATTLSTLGTLAYWNGRYNSTKSNLAYCKQGAFGTASTYAATTSITSGGTGLITSGAVYTGLAGKAPTAHATTALTYGGGTASNYGHVKLSDSYTSSAGAASASVAASSKAVADAYAEINSNLAVSITSDSTVITNTNVSIDYCIVRKSGNTKQYSISFIPSVSLSAYTVIGKLPSIQAEGKVNVIPAFCWEDNSIVFFYHQYDNLFAKSPLSASKTYRFTYECIV